jgi:hypothetical protein
MDGFQRKHAARGTQRSVPEGRTEGVQGLNSQVKSMDGWPTAPAKRAGGRVCGRPSFPAPPVIPRVQHPA